MPPARWLTTLRVRNFQMVVVIEISNGKLPAWVFNRSYLTLDSFLLPTLKIALKIYILIGILSMNSTNLLQKLLCHSTMFAQTTKEKFHSKVIPMFSKAILRDVLDFLLSWISICRSFCPYVRL